MKILHVFAYPGSDGKEGPSEFSGILAENWCSFSFESGGSHLCCADFANSLAYPSNWVLEKPEIPRRIMAEAVNLAHSTLPPDEGTCIRAGWGYSLCVHIKSAGFLTSGYHAITLCLSPLHCSGQVVCVGVTLSLEAAVQEQPGQSGWRPSLQLLGLLLALLVGTVLSGHVWLVKIVCFCCLQVVSVHGLCLLAGSHLHPPVPPLRLHDSREGNLFNRLSVVLYNGAFRFPSALLNAWTFPKSWAIWVPISHWYSGDFPIANPSVQLIWIALHSPAYPIMLNLGVMTQQ